jgi:hypothetical protein
MSDHPTRPTRIALGVAALAICAVLVGATRAHGDTGSHSVTLRSTVFAAQVGSLGNGGAVYAGAVVDPTLHHGAIVISANGTSTLTVTFQEFFAAGTIKGRGHLTVSPAPNGGQAVTGTLEVARGTAHYAGAHGELRVRGTVDSSSQIVATVRGSFTT